MAGLENILGQIRADAQSTAEQAAAQAQKQADELLEQARAEAREKSAREAERTEAMVRDAGERAKSAADLERLQAVITEMEAVKSDYYHQDEQWTAFQNKITEAKALKGTEKVTVPQVDDMIQALRDAKSALNSLVDKSELQELYDFCAAIPQNDVMDGNEVVAFLKARSDAETVLKDETASQTEVDEALKALSDTYGKIIPKRTTNEGHTDAAIVTELAAKLGEAKAVESPSGELTAAIAQAEAASESMATWKSVVEAIAALEAAMPSQPEQKVTVTFDTRGGSQIDPVEVEQGGILAKPADPTRSSYTFTGWYLDEACTKPFTFTDPVTEDLVLYAGWQYKGGSSGGGSGSSKPEQAATVTVTDAAGTVLSETSLTKKDVEEARESGQPLALPIPAVPAADDWGSAPAVTVDVPGGGSVKVEIPVEDLTPGTVAVLVKADGSEEIIKTSLTTDSGVVAALSDGDTVKIVDNTKRFIDVPDGYWAEASIAFTASRELFNGTGPKTFSPGLAMTRGMLVTVLARLTGADTSAGSLWYEAGQKWAVEKGISDGTNMEETLTREQLAAMLYRNAGSPEVRGDLSAFRDSGSVSSWAVQAMTWAVEQGLIVGVGNDTLAPQGEATRAQVATVFTRLVEKELL